jgi:hypothetical protein
MEEKKPAAKQQAKLCSNVVEIINALITNVLALVLYKILGRTTEYTVMFKLTQDDLIAINENFHLIVLGNIQSSPQFDWEHNTA